MSIHFNKGGILTTVQDLGRNGYASFGINRNGAMDQTAARSINILLGNDESEAVLEMHFPASEILFEKAAVFALGGANFAPELGGEAIENWRIYYADKGCVLKFKEKIFGNRAYFAAQNGFEIKKILESSSTSLAAKFGGFGGGKLQNGDRIGFNSVQNIANRKLQIANSFVPFYSRFPTVRVVEGAEYENLTALSEQEFLKTDYTVSLNSNRMGFRLTGKPLHLLTKKELISSAVNFGTIQLLPDGQLIILMADHQTSGGYPRIANIISTDLPLVAQLGADDKIAFHLISIEEAEDLLLDYEKDLNLLKVGVNYSIGLNRRQKSADRSCA